MVGVRLVSAGNFPDSGNRFLWTVCWCSGQGVEGLHIYVQKPVLFDWSHF